MHVDGRCNPKSYESRGSKTSSHQDHLELDIRLHPCATYTCDRKFLSFSCRVFNLFLVFWHLLKYWYSFSFKNSEIDYISGYISTLFFCILYSLLVYFCVLLFAYQTRFRYGTISPKANSTLTTFSKNTSSLSLRGLWFDCYRKTQHHPHNDDDSVWKW